MTPEEARGAVWDNAPGRRTAAIQDVQAVVGDQQVAVRLFDKRCILGSVHVTCVGLREPEQELGGADRVLRHDDATRKAAESGAGNAMLVSRKIKMETAHGIVPQLHSNAKRGMPQRRVGLVLVVPLGELPESLRVLMHGDPATRVRASRRGGPRRHLARP